jgi:tRNA wybutosine-synthesizing protein 3
MEYNFDQRKNDVLKKIDKSSKQSWDKKIVSLCNKINKSENYYTTSSCSGRVVLMIDQDKKADGLFLKIYHDKINFKNLKKDLENLQDKCFSPRRCETSRMCETPNTLKGTRHFSKKMFTESIKFKLEPPIIHVICKKLESASELVEFANHVGFRRSGINAISKNILVELNSTERLEFPIIRDGKILVDDEFLKIICDKSNFLLEKVWKKLDKLEYFFHTSD